MKAWGIAILALAICVGAASGKSPIYQINVSSAVDPKPRPIKYFTLAPGLQTIPATDADFREYSAYIVRALADQGLQRAEPGVKSDVVILTWYGLGDPTVQTAGYEARTTGREHSRLLMYSPSAVDASTNYENLEAGKGGAASPSSKRFLRVAAFYAAELQNGGGLVTAFDTRVTVANVDEDLKTIMPAMVAAARPYIGKRTPKTVTVKLDPADAQIAAIRQ